MALLWPCPRRTACTAIPTEGQARYITARFRQYNMIPVPKTGIKPARFRQYKISPVPKRGTETARFRQCKMSTVPKRGIKTARFDNAKWALHRKA